MSAWVWLAGDPARQRALEPVVAALVADAGVEWIRRRPGRRSLAKAHLDDGTPCFLKLYVTGERHPWRDRWKQWLSLSTAEREWRAAVRLRRSGVRVPEPWARLRLDSGEQVLVTEWLDAVPLDVALGGQPDARRGVLERTGQLIRRLHAAGYAHRDLHRENVLVREGEAWLIDLQAVTRFASPRMQLRDLGQLDHSLRRELSFPDRVRLRAAALGLCRPFDAASRRQIRSVGRASLSRGRRHARSRAARSLRPGRRARRFAAAGGHGLVSPEVEAAAIAEALETGGHHRRFEVRRFAPRVADLWQGSRARRAWAAAHALEANDIPHVEPLAFVEWRRLGWPTGSALVTRSGSDAPELSGDAVLDAETTLWIQLHESGFRTPGLEAQPPLLVSASGGPAAAGVGDLTRVVFAGRLTNAERRDSFGSLQARWRASGARTEALERAQQRYSRRLPLSVEAHRRDELRERIRRR